MRVTTIRTKCLAVPGIALCMATQAQAIDVFLDFTDFATNADIAWAAAGSPGGALTATDILYLTAHAIPTKMAAQYAGYTVTFHTTTPGGVHEKIRFGASTGFSGLFGEAERLDWRNAFKDDVADVFAHNFGSVIAAVPSDHSTSVERFANALAGTAGHELGHNLGLQHYDAYGYPTIFAPVYAGVVGQQNDSIMATGGTGLTLARRGDDARSFNEREHFKLDYADGVSAALGLTVSEVVGSHSSFATAQFVGGGLITGGKFGVNITAETGTPGQTDMYKFTATAGSLLSLNTFSHFIMSSATDTSVTLFKDDGTPLMANGDISYSGMSFMGGPGPYSADSLIQNLAAPYTGTYYASVTGTASGDYDLLITGLDAVPEPATVLLLASAAAVVARKRRKTG